MTNTKSLIETATQQLVAELNWQSVLIDMEVEQRGKATTPYYVDSSVAVCICEIDGKWVDSDLNLPSEYRKLFHALYDSDGEQWGSCRLLIASDNSATWSFNSQPPRRLNGVATIEIDELIDELLLRAKQ